MATKNEERIKRLTETHNLPREDFKQLLSTLTDDEAEILYAAARRVREAVYGKAVYLRGLIEFTNVCKNNCYYCGIRRDNARISATV
jgi:biotin synthase